MEKNWKKNVAIPLHAPFHFRNENSPGNPHEQNSSPTEEKNSTMKRMKRIFLTGGTGFFGRTLLDALLTGAWKECRWVLLSRDPERFLRECPEFLELSDRVEFLRGDIRDFAFPAGEFSAVLHGATPAVTDLSDTEMTSIIVEGTRHVLEFVRARGIPRLLLVSSGAVYGPALPGIRRIPEDHPLRPVTAYGRGKLAAERLCLSELGDGCVIARGFAFVGPRLNFNIHYAVGNFIRDALAGGPILIKGDGTPIRSYLGNDDLVHWLMTLLERGHGGRIYNFGSDCGMSIAEVAEGVRSALNSKAEIRILTPPQDHREGKAPEVYVPDISRARTELGLDVTVDFPSAIRAAAARHSRR